MICEFWIFVELEIHFVKYEANVFNLHKMNKRHIDISNHRHLVRWFQYFIGSIQIVKWPYRSNSSAHLLSFAVEYWESLYAFSIFKKWTTPPIARHHYRNLVGQPSNENQINQWIVCRLDSQSVSNKINLSFTQTEWSSSGRAEFASTSNAY